MARVILVRHGQASFGSDDYDRLSPLGHVQCRSLGSHAAARGWRFQAVLRGTLVRHQQSLHAMQEALPKLPEAHALAGLNEYDSEALLAAVAHQPAHRAPLERITDASQAREHFRRLREALLQWMRGEIAPIGMQPYQQFKQGIVDALQQAHAASRSGDVLIVSSGGPIGTAVAHLVGAPDTTMVALNMRLRNSAVTELASTAKGLELVSFNELPHLVQDPSLQTHA